MRQREAPSARRKAISLRLVVARANMRLATLAQAINNMNATAVKITRNDWRESPTSFLFSENQGCFVVAADKAIDIPAFADAAGIPALLIGDTDDEGEFFSFSSPDTLDNGKLIREGPSFWLELADLRAAHEGFFPKLMGADAALA